MGVYFYTLKRLAKPVTITREDGQVAVVEHKLEYRTKAGGWDEDDRRIERATARAYDAFGYRFQGFVAHGSVVIAWNGDPTWYDTGDYEGQVWGYRTGTKGRYGKSARMPSITVEVLHEGAKRPIRHLLECVASATYKYPGEPWPKLLASRTCCAVRWADGRIEFRVDPPGEGEDNLEFPSTFPDAGLDGAGLLQALRAYALVVQDRLIEMTPVPVSEAQVAGA